jgi:hypothetical protein
VPVAADSERVVGSPPVAGGNLDFTNPTFVDGFGANAPAVFATVALHPGWLRSVSLGAV